MGNFSRSMSKFDVFITASRSLRSSSFHFFSDLGRAGKKNYDVNENILFAELRLTVMTHSSRAREAFKIGSPRCVTRLFSAEVYEPRSIITPPTTRLSLAQKIPSLLYHEPILRELCRGGFCCHQNGINPAFTKNGKC